MDFYLIRFEAGSNFAQPRITRRNRNISPQHRSAPVKGRSGLRDPALLNSMSWAGKMLAFVVRPRDDVLGFGGRLAEASQQLRDLLMALLTAGVVEIATSGKLCNSGKFNQIVP